MILVDAANGLNLGYQYLKLVNKSLNYEFNIENILNEIIIVRAFTFYQMLNIIINENPEFVIQYINNSNNKVQIIIVDFLHTLIILSNKINTKDKCRNFSFNRDFKEIG